MSKSSHSQEVSLSYRRPFLRTPYNYDRDAVSDSTGLLCPEPSLSQQSAKDETDINLMLERMARGVQPNMNAYKPQWGVDVTDSPSDYHSAMNLVVNAQNAFNALDAVTRDRFDNDPAKLMAFVADDKNRDEAQKLGLLNAVVSPTTVDLSPASLDALKQQASEAGGKSGKGAGKRFFARQEGEDGEE